MPFGQSDAMDATPFTDMPTLRGEWVTLRTARAEDADAIDAIIRSRSVASASPRRSAAARFPRQCGGVPVTGANLVVDGGWSAVLPG